MSTSVDTVLAAHPARDAILRRQRERESSARTYARWVDIVPDRAAGAWITAADGRRYLDCLSGAGTLALGHNHPEVVDALRATLDRGSPLHVLDVATAEKDAFVTELFRTLPTAFLARRPRIQFCGPTGADAVEAAIKLCQTATGRRGVASFTGAYHGMTLATLDASGGVAAKRWTGSAGLDVVRLPYPYPLRCPFGIGDADGTVAATYAARLLDDPSGGSLPPALLLVEPVQGEGGVIPGPAPWLRSIAATARRHDVPLVVDEIQTGVGRTGTLWAHEQAGIVPDAIVVSKAVGGGLPLSAVVYAEELDVWGPGAHAGTFRGNVLAMVAGTTTLRIVQRDGLAERAATLGARMLDALRRGLAGVPHVAEVRGRGLMLGVELTDPAAGPGPTGLPAPGSALAADVRRRCLEQGMVVEVGGRHDTVLRLLPPLTIDAGDADLAVEIVTAAIVAAGADGGAA